MCNNVTAFHITACLQLVETVYLMLCVLTTVFKKRTGENCCYMLLSPTRGSRRINGDKPYSPPTSEERGEPSWKAGRSGSSSAIDGPAMAVSLHPAQLDPSGTNGGHPAEVTHRLPRARGSRHMRMSGRTGGHPYTPLRGVGGS